MASVVGIPSEDSTTLGVPDLLLELDRSGRSIALFILEVNFSQDLNDLFKKVKRFTSSCGDVQAITIIDIHESQPHKKPGDTSELAHEMMG